MYSGGHLGGNAWLVQEKLAEAYSHGIKKLEYEIVDSKNDLRESNSKIEIHSRNKGSA